MSDSQISWLISLGFFVPILSWGTKPKINKAGKDIILEMHDKGMHSKEISADLGLTVGYVVNVISTHRGRKRTFNRPSPMKEKIIALYKKGVSPLDIVEKLGAGRCYVYDTISAYKKENGVPKERTTETRDKILECYRKGLSSQAIAKEVGVSYPHVNYVLRRAGLTRNIDWIVYKTVVRLSDTGKVLESFSNTKEAADRFKVPHNVIVAICTPGIKRYKTSDGLKFAYEENMSVKNE